MVDELNTIIIIITLSCMAIYICIVLFMELMFGEFRKKDDDEDKE